MSLLSSSYNPPLNFTSPPLALCSAILHLGLKTELVKLSYTDSTPAPPHVRNHHRLQPYSPKLSLRLDFPDFDLTPKHNEKFGYCGLDLV